jgi:hypothetical protein
MSGRVRRETGTVSRRLAPRLRSEAIAAAGRVGSTLDAELALEGHGVPVFQ